METLRRLRSLVAFLLTLLWFVPGALVLYLGVLPLTWAFPARTPALATWYVKMMSATFLRLLRLGGARFELRGTIPTADPCLIVSNHQSLLDICIIFLQSHPMATGFIARSRYASVPVVGTAMRLAACPSIDPRRDPKGAVAIIAAAARQLKHALVIFPEGHRTRTGEILPWRTAGLTAILGARRLPVYLVVTDGLWRSPRLVDFVFGVHRISAVSETLGPFTPPDSEDELPAFLDGLRSAMAGHLAEMRRRRDDVAA
jgi:1-acyl-sn-glycerol-3-phosphate acyltransferase